MSADNKIDLTEIDWSNLSLESFNNLHKNLEVEKKPRKKRAENNKLKTVKISGILLAISEQEYLRLKTMKNQKSIEKLKNSLLLKYEEIKPI